MNPFISTHIHLLKDVRGVIQCGMGWDPKEVEIWNQHGIKNQIYVEPLPRAFATLLTETAKYRSPDTDIHCFNCAASNVDGEAKFHVSINPNSCSLLEFDEGRPEILKNDYMTDTIKVQTFRLDSLVKLIGIDWKKYNLLFLDVQCGEHLVLAGAREVLPYMEYVAMEVATVSVYTGSLLYDEYSMLMWGLGFEEFAKEPLYVTPEGEVYTYDVLYKRRGM